MFHLFFRRLRRIRKRRHHSETRVLIHGGLVVCQQVHRQLARQRRDDLPQRGHLSLKIFNVRGELVRTLINEVRPEGAGHVLWDGASDQGRRVSSGIYFYEARTDSEVQVNKLTLVK